MKEIEFDGLIDTGAQVSCVQEKFMLENLKNVKREETYLFLKHAFDEGIEIKEKITEETVIGSVKFKISFLVVPGLSAEVIIGADLLRHGTFDLRKGFGSFFDKKNVIKLYHKKQGIRREKQVVRRIQNSLITEEQRKELFTEIEEIKSIRFAENENPEVLNKELKLMKELVLCFPEVFSEEFRAGSINCRPLKFRFRDNQPPTEPVRCRYRKPAGSQLEICRKWVKEHLASEAIEPSESVHDNGIFCVPKPDKVLKSGERIKQWRVVVPMVAMNEFIDPPARTAPTIWDMKEILAGCSHYTTFDLREGFYNLPIHPEHRQYTAFNLSGAGHYQYRTLPMGCVSSPALFQIVMEELLSEFLFNGIIIYVDDIIVYSTGTYKEHVELVRKIIERLKFINAKLKLRKCYLGRQEVRFLGMKLSVDGWEISQHYEGILNKIKPPRSLRELRSLIGAFNWVRDWIPEYYKHVGPLLLLNRKDNNILKLWTQDHTDCLENLKEKVRKATQLKHLDPSKPFLLYSDASLGGCGAALCQVFDGSSRSKPVGFFSHAFTSAEKNYGIPEKETLGCVLAIEHFRPLILGRQLTVFTDQRSILWLLSQPKGGKYARYRERLSIFAPKFEYIQGSYNTLADYLSRYFDFEEKEEIDYLESERFIFAQNISVKPRDGVTGDDGIIRINNRVWIPPIAQEVLSHEFKDDPTGLEYFIKNGEVGDPAKWKHSDDCKLCQNDLNLEDISEGLRINRIENLLNEQFYREDGLFCALEKALEDQGINLFENTKWENRKEKLDENRSPFVDFTSSESEVVDEDNNNKEEKIKNKSSNLPQKIKKKDSLESRLSKKQAGADGLRNGTLVWSSTDSSEDRRYSKRIAERQAKETGTGLSTRNFKQFRIEAIQLAGEVNLRRICPLDASESMIEKGSGSFKYGEYRFNLSDFAYDQGVITYRGRILVPERMGHELVNYFHHKAPLIKHCSKNRMKNYLKERFFWLKMEEDITSVADSCKTCCKYKNSTMRIPEEPLLAVEYPFQSIHVDVYGQKALEKCKGYSCILTVIDSFSRWVEFLPLKSSKESSILKALEKWFFQFGIPNSVHSDNGLFFKTSENLFSEHGIKLSTSASYAPWMNGKAERVHKELTEELKIELEFSKNWPDALKLISFKINSLPRKIFKGLSAFELLYGVSPRLTKEKQNSEKQGIKKKIREEVLDKLKDLGKPTKDVKTNLIMGDNVMWRPNKPNRKFNVTSVKGTIVGFEGEHILLLKVSNGSIRRAATKDCCLLL